MSLKVVDLNCPGCGASVNTSNKECMYCGRRIIVSSFTDVFSASSADLIKNAKAYQEGLSRSPDNQELSLSAALCFLKMKLYDKAAACFNKAIENDILNPEAYFYAAVTLLKGQKAFSTPKKDIERALALTDAAIQLEPRGIFYYFKAYMKQDFYDRKSLNISPDHNAELGLSEAHNVTEADIQMLFDTLGQKVPQEISIF